MAGADRVAILLEQVGSPSEIFIRRHIECFAHDVLVIARAQPPPSQMHWGHDLAVHVVPQARLSRLERLTRMLHRGLPYPGRRERRALAAILEGAGAETVLVEYLNPWLPFLTTVLRTGVRVFGHAHGYDVSRIPQDVRWARAYESWNRAHGVIVPAQHMHDRLAQLGIDEAKVHVIPYGVEVPAAPPGADSDGDDGFRLLAVGRLVEKKAPLLTLAAFRSASRLVPGLRLDMVGEGPLRATVERYVADQELTGAVTLWGAQPHSVVEQLMVNCDAFIQHSRTDPATGDQEGLPVAILEAMAHGLPVIATRHAGIPDAVVEDETGLLVDEGDVEGMCVAIADLARDRAGANRLGAAGWERARDHFSVQQQCARLRRLLLRPTPQ